MIDDLAFRVVTAARGWIGTPYHHQASCRGVGVDCLGLVRGVWRDVYGAEAEAPPNYSADWAEASGRETLLDAAGRHFIVKDARHVMPGDVVVFRLRPTMVAKHCGIVTGSAAFVHAMEGCPVAEVALSSWWRRRIAGAYSFRTIGTAD